MTEVTEYLTLDEAAAKLKCHPRTLIRLIKKGRLPAKNLGVGKHAEFRIEPANRAKLDFTPMPSLGDAKRRYVRRPTFRRLVGKE